MPYKTFICLKSDSPLVSIALCTYNGGMYLIEQLQSLFNQTYLNIEIIVVDDGSTDNTREILEQCSKRENIKAYFNEENLGFVKNFEKAISKCSGDYIALCDQDDIWKPEKVELLMKNIQDHILIYANSEIIDKEGNSLNTQLTSIRNFVSGNNPIPFIFHNCIPGHTMLFKKDLIKFIVPFPAEVIFHDWYIAFAAASVGKITYLDQCLVMYRQHEATNTDILKARTKRIVEDKKSTKLERITRDIIDKITIYYNFKYLNQKDKEIIKNLIEGYEGRIGSFFSVKLFLLLLNQRDNIYFIPKYSFFKKILNVFKESWGTRTKKAFYQIKEKF